MADKMTRPTPKPAFIPGKPGKATRKESTFNIEEAIKKMQKSERSLSEADIKALGEMIKPENPPMPRGSITGKMNESLRRNFKKGGAVCRGGRSAERGTSFRGVR
jgi:hypothetical protein